MSEISEHDKAVLNSIFNPNLPLGEAAFDDDLTSKIKVDEVENIDGVKELELEGVKAAEIGNLDLSLAKLSEAIAKAPQVASFYNNRAQVYRLLGNNKAALENIEKAIEISGKNGKSYCQALCQRGILHRLNGKIDEARNDFQIAAQLGSTFAKQQMVELNPYAALCNAMLKKVISDLK